MSFGFLFWFYLVGILIASLQDLKRREVDNWLNLFLGIGGAVFVLYTAFFEKDLMLALSLLVGFAVTFIAMNAFYYGRVFAGGDAKLLLAMSPIFVSSGLLLTLKNIGIFLGLLMLSGSIYGVFYSLVLYFKNFKKSNVQMRKIIQDKKFVKPLFFFGLMIFVIGILLMLTKTRIGFVVMMTGLLVLLFPLLYIFSKSLEKVSMVRSLPGSKLREGDWLVNDVRCKGKLVKSSWEGLSKEDLKLLKSKKKVLIKEGLPFVPAFLIAFLLYYFFGDILLNFINLL